MAHFRATIQGMRGEASRLGTKHSGMIATIDGWDIGCDVTIRHHDGYDVVRISLTGGSNDLSVYDSHEYKLINNKPRLINE